MKKDYGHRVSVRMYDDLRAAIAAAIEKRGDDKVKNPSAYIKDAVLKSLKKDGVKFG